MCNSEHLCGERVRQETITQNCHRADELQVHESSEMMLKTFNVVHRLARSIGIMFSTNGPPDRERRRGHVGSLHSTAAGAAAGWPQDMSTSLELAGKTNLKLVGVSACHQARFAQWPLEV